MAELFPAYAGVIPGTSGRAGHGKTFPRPCGGDPSHRSYASREVAFSPPTRGFHIDNPAQKADNRFILNAERGKVYAVF